MWFFQSVTLICICIGLPVSLTSYQPNNIKRDVREYCMQDRFNVSCKVDEVIMMTSALYGRMKAGHCKIGETKLKCAVDILPNMDKMCSGFRTCDFVFPGTNTGIFDKKPCGHDHLSYMEASHECVKVENGSEAQCLNKRFIKINNHHGFLSSETTDANNIGSIHCPWLIETYPGQKINLTIYNLANNTSGRNKFHSPYTFNGAYKNSYIKMHQDYINIDTDDIRPKHCLNDEKIAIGVIYEARNQETVEMCLNTDNRILKRYTSQTNNLEFRFEDKSMMKNIGRFLVEYRISGCPDIEVPADTFAKRDGDTLRVKCNHTKNAWYLICNDGSWVGEVGNCSLGSGVEILNLDYNVNVEGTEIFPLGILFVVAIGVAIGIVFGGGLLICLVIYNKRNCRDPISFVGGVKNENSTMYVSPETRAWINAHQHPKESEQQYTDEGIVRDIHGSRDSALYGEDVLRNDNMVGSGIHQHHHYQHAAPINQANFPHPLHCGHGDVNVKTGGGGTRQDMPVPQPPQSVIQQSGGGSRIPEQIGMHMHMYEYERPQST